MMCQWKNKTTLSCVFPNDSMSPASSLHIPDKGYLDIQSENHPGFLTALSPEKSPTSLSPPYIHLTQSQIINLPPEVLHTSLLCVPSLTAMSQ